MPPYTDVANFLNSVDHKNEDENTKNFIDNLNSRGGKEDDQIHG